MLDQPRHGWRSAKRTLEDRGGLEDGKGRGGYARLAVPRFVLLRGHDGGRGRRLHQGGDGPGRIVLAADGTPLCVEAIPLLADAICCEKVECRLSMVISIAYVNVSVPRS
jgi:hypothetical protein